MTDGDAATVRALTRVCAPPLVPEICLHLADEPFAAWEATQRGGAASDVPPPFWAFAWAGGQALARHVLDHPESVAGRRVLDLASGSGLVAIAAALAGARSVTACDIDPLAATAIGLNAALNGVRLDVLADDVLDRDLDGVDVILAGDVCYDADLAGAMMTFLRAQRRRGVEVLLGDPLRPYLPDGLTTVARYEVAGTANLEERAVTAAAVFAIPR
ncbi:class I SAM-dependent methyltransferase [Actinoallomurus rhizosphaericola]|uniref:class I SAM-dependent methyltransferase n=1 Tax=Actinoallomurus rhizosphaericola TaxID=2952536 RepID=UPI0020934CA8|nr:50S ribosomal protein L11 methyltransferase [Actinoallomurus rhizosphaericola]MCO5999484.1 50S ribosomal protein L11 methyltransferase [Actinoallomurus rhizosphaericola]